MCVLREIYNYLTGLLSVRRAVETTEGNCVCNLLTRYGLGPIFGRRRMRLGGGRWEEFI